MGEKNRMRWVGVQPTDPEQNIPVKQGTAANLKATVNIAPNQTVIVKQDTPANLKSQIYSTDAGIKIYPCIPSGYVHVQEYAEAENSIVIIYTVPAGKIFYMTDIVLIMYNLLRGLGTVQIRDENNLNPKVLLGGGVTAELGMTYNKTFVIPYEVNSLYDIILTSAHKSVYCYAYILGYRTP